MGGFAAGLALGCMNPQLVRLHFMMLLVAARKLIGCVFLLGFSFLVSCATARIEQADAHFTGPAIETERMAIGPVVQVGGESIATHDAETIRNELGSAIAKKRGFIRVQAVETPTLIRLDNGSAERALSSSYRASLLKKGIRFVLLTEVTGNRIGYDIDQSCEEETEEVYDRCGKLLGHRVIRTDYTTRSKTTRNLEARFKVFDLQVDRSVWVTRSDYANTATNQLESCHCYPPAPPYPAPPRVAGMCHPLAKAAVRKLPRL